MLWFRVLRVMLTSGVLTLGAILLPSACSLDDRVVTRARERAAESPSEGGDSTGGVGVSPAGAPSDGGAPGPGPGEPEAPCDEAEDCPASEDECRRPACQSGSCGFENVDADTPVGADAAGDCQKTVCDGKGKSVITSDDVDVPDDHNECTVDSCEHGERSHAPEPPTVTCGEGAKQHCDGDGKCACLGAEDCGTSDNPCASFSCVARKCEIAYVPKGEGQLPQAARDCQQNMCDGSGNAVAVAQPLDVPVDDNPCTKDLCSDSGTPSNPPVVAQTPCGNGKSCDGLGGCSCSDPNACAGKCGPIKDACGLNRDCGNPCTGFNSCGGGGAPNVCGCTPVVPDCHFQFCGGLYPNGCGQNVACKNYDSCLGGSCGNCQGFCTAGNTCQCDAPPCS